MNKLIARLMDKMMEKKVYLTGNYLYGAHDELSHIKGSKSWKIVRVNSASRELKYMSEDFEAILNYFLDAS